MQTTSKIDYVQGLRALCVLVVLGFHLDETWLPSGFLGVDAFFAISGFVITRMILNQIGQEQFSLRSFYFSRINKLFPPLLFVIAISVVVFSWLYKGSDLYEMYLSGMFSTISLSNIYFYFDAGYFSHESIYKPFLHTWSLSVEEQFYLVWPILLLWLARKGLLKFKAMSLLTITFVFVCALLITRYFDLIFYLMPFRAYQLLLGIVAALFCYQYERSVAFPYVVQIKIIAPIIVLVLTLFQFETPLAQLVAQFTTSLAISAACCAASFAKFDNSLTLTSNTETVVKSIFESKVSLYLGGRSYQIYLVHWPIICFAVYHDSDISNVNKILLGLYSIAAAELLWRGVHLIKWISQEGMPTLYKAFMVSLVLISVSPGIHHLVKKNHGVRGFDATKVLTLKQLRKQLANELDHLECNISMRPQNEEEAFKRLSSCLDHNSVLVMGDSLTRGPFLGLIRSLPERPIVRLFINGCPPYFGDDQSQLEEFHEIRNCAKFTEYPWKGIKDRLRELNIETLIIAGNWQAKAYNTNSLRASVEGMSTLTSEVTLVGVRPFFSENIVRLSESGYFKVNGPSLDSLLHKVKNLPNTETINQIMKDLAADASNIDYVDVYEDLCGIECLGLNNNNLLYTDFSHLSLAGADHLTQQKNFNKLLLGLK